MAQNRPLLTIGMIVKNEIRCIERCLKALEPLRKAIPCELIIADTGSEDGTRKVIERYADVVFDFPWINDFAAARNAVMDRSSGQWYFSVDADEYLDEDIHELVGFLTTPQQKKWNSAGLIVRNYPTREMEPDSGNDFLALRLLRMSTGVRFTGKIHETWNLAGEISYGLKYTILHHDGYAMVSPEYARKKSERNLTLLRDELAQNPKDPKLLLQCIESSTVFPQEQWSYVLKSMEYMLNGTMDLEHSYVPALCRYSLCGVLKQQLPQSEEWLEWGNAHFSDSIFFRVDVAAVACIYYWGKKQYDDVLMWGERYFTGLKDFENRNFKLSEISRSTLVCKNHEYQLMCCEAMADSLIHFERYREAMERLVQVKPWTDNPQQSANYLLLLARLVKFPETEEQAKDICTEFFHTLFTNKKIKQKTYRICMQVLVQQFEQQDEHGSQLFEKIPGDIGLAARMMDQTDQQVLSSMLEQVENWKKIPAIVVLHGIKCCAHFPKSFYQRNYHTLQKSISTLAKMGIPFTDFVEWAEQECAESLVSLHFFADLCVVIVARANTGQTQDSNSKIYMLLQSLLTKYLTRLYSSTLRQQQEEWNALPEVHQFGLWLIKAQEALELEDELGYIRALKTALEVTPAMKNMVTFLVQQLERKKRESTSPELRALADKVRTILAQYPPDDPAVEALKQSEVYQKVAYLIEGMEAPAFGGLTQ